MASIISQQKWPPTLEAWKAERGQPQERSTGTRMDYHNLEARLMQEKFSISFSNNGVAMQATNRVRTSNHVRARRGKVEGFSSAACRRLRQFLWKVDYSDAVAVTLTRPHSAEAELLGLRSSESTFDAMNKHIERFEFVRSLIWRKEVTAQGEVHYHCVLVPSASFDAVEAAMLLVEEWIRQMLLDAHRNLASCGVDTSKIDAVPFDQYLNDSVEKMAEKMRKAHFDKRKPCIQCFGDNTGYVSYILNHQSKHKAYQCKTTGRTWGVWHRADLPLLQPDSIPTSKSEFYQVGRILRKVSRYRVNDERAPFGWYHTNGRRVQSHGRTVYFAKRLDGNLGERIREYLALLRSQA